jgi:hypothetical protein
MSQLGHGLMCKMRIELGLFVHCASYTRTVVTAVKMSSAS